MSSRAFIGVCEAVPKLPEILWEEGKVTCLFVGVYSAWVLLGVQNHTHHCKSYALTLYVASVVDTVLSGLSFTSRCCC